MTNTLTLRHRFKLIIEILTIRSGHKHTANEKQLSTFQKGYHAGMKDAGYYEKIR
jgi:hypothetical protein